MDNEKMKNVSLKELYLYYNNIDKVKEPERAEMILELIKEKEQTPQFNEPRLAQRPVRLAAIFLDVAVITPVIIYLIFFTDITSQYDKTRTDPLFFLMHLLFAQSLFLLLNGYFLYKYGQTIGKRLLKIKIVSVDNTRTPFIRVYWLRYFLFALCSGVPVLGFFFSIFDPLLIFRKDRRCLHDILAGTKVVEA
ncbi:MAG: hypothetical protein SCALA702_10730 [Melioribacteraceae bacterium]|nr:MAG: hypothetical protein SCALA702_10730 [Melioribacteraceae bacterium]